MIAWMLYATFATAMVAGAALAAEEAARLLRRPRRWGWTAGMAAAAGLPLLLRFVPAPSAPASAGQSVDPALLAELLARAPAAATPAGLIETILGSRAADPMLTAIWLAAAAIMTGALLLTYWHLRRVRASAYRIEIAGVPALLTHTTGPMVVGVRHPEVVVPRWIDTLTDVERSLVVRHEWEHVRAGDTRLLLASAVLVAAMPWNLPLWWMRWRLRQALEVDCDARVLSSGVDRRIYGTMLIQTAGRPGPTPLLAPALVELPSLLERRIVAMTSKYPAHPGVRLAAVAGMGALLFVAACELTPRGGAPSPTEPTMADVLEPGDTEVSERVVMEFEQSADTVADVVSVAEMLDGDLSISEVRVNGDSLVRVRVRVNSVGQADQGSDSYPRVAAEAKPMILVDGQRVTSIANIDRNRIQEISVLKGPAAVAKFGAEARDGVIKVTTGEPGAVRVRGARAGVVAPQVIEGVVVAGYGLPRVKEGAPTEVEAFKFEPAAVALTAKVTAAGSARAATVVVPPEGLTATGYSIRIRGADSRAQPLIIVDGKQVSSLDDIDPATIESISVIKDATATERWGERGRNGVIVVTSKQ